MTESNPPTMVMEFADAVQRGKEVVLARLVTATTAKPQQPPIPNEERTRLLEAELVTLDLQLWLSIARARQKVLLFWFKQQQQHQQLPATTTATSPTCTTMVTEHDLHEAYMVHVLVKLAHLTDMRTIRKSLRQTLQVNRQDMDHYNGSFLQLLLDEDHCFDEIYTNTTTTHGPDDDDDHHHHHGIFQLTNHLVVATTGSYASSRILQQQGRPSKRARTDSYGTASHLVAPFGNNHNPRKNHTWKVAAVYIISQLTLDIYRQNNGWRMDDLDDIIDPVIKLVLEKLTAALPDLRHSSWARAGMVLFLIDTLVNHQNVATLGQGATLKQLVTLLSQDPTDIYERIAEATGIPLDAVGARMTERLMRLENSYPSRDQLVLACKKAIREVRIHLYLNHIMAIKDGVVDPITTAPATPTGQTHPCQSDQLRTELSRRGYPIIVHIKYHLFRNEFQEAVHIASKVEKCPAVSDEDKVMAYSLLFNHCLQTGELFFPHYHPKMLELTLLPFVGRLGMVVFAEYYHTLCDKLGPAATEAERTYVRYASHQALLRLLVVRYSEQDGIKQFEQYWTVPPLSCERRVQWATEFLHTQHDIPDSIRVQHEDGSIGIDLVQILRRSYPPEAQLQDTKQAQLIAINDDESDRDGQQEDKEVHLLAADSMPEKTAVQEYEVDEYPEDWRKEEEEEFVDSRESLSVLEAGASASHASDLVDMDVDSRDDMNIAGSMGLARSDDGSSPPSEEYFDNQSSDVLVADSSSQADAGYEPEDSQDHITEEDEDHAEGAVSAVLLAHQHHALGAISQEELVESASAVAPNPDAQPEPDPGYEAEGSQAQNSDEEGVQSGKKASHAEADYWADAGYEPEDSQDHVSDEEEEPAEGDAPIIQQPLRDIVSAAVVEPSVTVALNPEVQIELDPGYEAEESQAHNSGEEGSRSRAEDLYQADLGYEPEDSQDHVSDDEEEPAEGAVPIMQQQSQTLVVASVEVVESSITIALYPETQIDLDPGYEGEESQAQNSEDDRVQSKKKASQVNASYSSQGDAGYEPEDSQDHVTEEEEEHIDGTVPIMQSSHDDCDEMGKVSQEAQVLIAVVPNADAEMELDPGYEAEGSQAQNSEASHVEAGYEAEDSHDHTEEETEDDLDDRLRNKIAVELADDQDKKDMTGNEGTHPMDYMLSDMDAADERTTTGHDEELGAEAPGGDEDRDEESESVHCGLEVSTPVSNLASASLASPDRTVKSDPAARTAETKQANEEGDNDGSPLAHSIVSTLTSTTQATSRERDVQAPRADDHDDRKHRSPGAASLTDNMASDEHIASDERMDDQGTAEDRLSQTDRDDTVSTAPLGDSEENQQYGSPNAALLASTQNLGASGEGTLRSSPGIKARLRKGRKESAASPSSSRKAKRIAFDSPSDESQDESIASKSTARTGKRGRKSSQLAPIDENTSIDRSSVVDEVIVVSKKEAGKAKRMQPPRSHTGTISTRASSRAASRTTQSGNKSVEQAAEKQSRAAAAVAADGRGKKSAKRSADSDSDTRTSTAGGGAPRPPRRPRLDSETSDKETKRSSSSTAISTRSRRTTRSGRKIG